MGCYKAKPMSRTDIRQITKEIRVVLGIHEQEKVDVVQLMENVLPILTDGNFEAEVVPDEELPVLALTTHDEGKIKVRESVYIGACEGNGRDRFTIMHEIAHFFLHKGVKVRLARGNEEIKRYEDPEWQADAFAGEFLMPYDIVKDKNIYEISKSCGVSMSAAQYQFKQYQKRKKTGI